MFGRPLFIEFLECSGQSRPRGVARRAKTGFDSAKRNARGYSCSSFLSGSGNARYLGFSYSFLARQASKTPRGRVAGPPGRGSKEKTNGTYKTVRFFVFQEKHPIFALTV